MKDNYSVSEIISIYNEESIISGVVETVLFYNSVDEVIAVNDGS